MANTIATYMKNGGKEEIGNYLRESIRGVREAYQDAKIKTGEIIHGLQSPDYRQELTHRLGEGISRNMDGEAALEKLRLASNTTLGILGYYTGLSYLAGKIKDAYENMRASYEREQCERRWEECGERWAKMKDMEKYDMLDREPVVVDAHFFPEPQEPQGLEGLCYEPELMAA
ncbi:hypothetical protein KY345_04785 [Candidatus Woesearchaeota archaeon]|nr:hypothetical protein [Candidatus Woesearchaeota archaeon]